MEEIIFLIVFGFIAAFVDSIAGGGGLISVPALLTTGINPQIALGTNKLQSTCASMISSFTYLKSNKVNKRLLLKLLPFTLIGAIIGVIIVKYLSNDWLHPIVITLLVTMMVYTILKKDWGDIDKKIVITRKIIISMMTLAFIIGIYDGFFGPGTGTFLIFMFLMTDSGFVQASANAKILNTLSNIVALVVFLLFGLVNIKYGIIMAVAGIPGAYLGTKVAVTKGAKIVKPVFVMITLGLIIKLLIGQ